MNKISKISKIFFAIAVFVSALLSINFVLASCTPPTSGAWIIDEGEICTLSGQTIDVAGSTIDPYTHASLGINILVYGTLYVTGGTINLNDISSLGHIRALKNGKLTLRGTQLTTKSPKGGVTIDTRPGGTVSAYLSGLTFMAGEFDGGPVEVLDSTITNYDYNRGDANITLTRVSVLGGAVTNTAGTLIVLSSSLLNLGSAGGNVIVKDSTVSNLIQIGGGNADFTNVVARNAFQMFGDSTTTISNSPSLNEIYVWADSWLANYVGHPTVTVSNSKAKTIVTNIGKTTQLDVDGLGTADGTYKNYASKVIQSSSHPRYKISLTNVDIANYNLYAYGNSVAKISNSYISLSEIKENADVTFTNSGFSGTSYIYGTSKVTATNSNLEKLATFPYLYLLQTPKLSFDKSTIGKGSALYVNSDANVQFSGTVTIGPNDNTGLKVYYWAPGGKITREYPVYVGTAGVGVTIKDAGGIVVWSGTSGADKWVYPVIVFDNINYQSKLTIYIAGVGSKQIDFWTSTPIEFVPQAPSVLGTPCVGTEYACGLVKASTGDCIQSGDGYVKLCVPAGSLTQDAYVSINKADPLTATVKVKGGFKLERYYTIQVSGLTFNPPAELTIVYIPDPGEKLPAVSSFNSWLSIDNVNWEQLKSTAVQEGNSIKITSLLNHLSFVVLLQVDVDSPVTNAVISCTYESAPFDSWCKDSATVTLTATDNYLNTDSGVDKTLYSFDNVNWFAYSTPIVARTAGTNAIYYYSVDKAGLLETVKSLNVRIDKDADGDAVYDNFDRCPSTAGLADRQGCKFGDLSTIELHTVDLTVDKSLCGGKTTCKVPLGNVEVKIFNRDDSSFQSLFTREPAKTSYPEIFAGTAGFVSDCTTDATGKCTAGENSVGNYLMIAKYATPEGKIIYTGRNKDISDFKDSNGDGVVDLASRDFQKIKVKAKDGSFQYQSGGKILIVGSTLEIIYPDYMIWDSSNTYYPFVFTSYDSTEDWIVDVCAQVPQGYTIVVESCSQAFVGKESKVILFQIAEVGSPEPDATFTLTTKHKGIVQKHTINVKGKRGPVYAAVKAKKGKETPLTGLAVGLKHQLSN